MTSRAVCINLRNVTKSYGKPPVNAVENFSLSITSGEFFCLIGPSGCGKSTVIKMIAGIESPSSGTVLRPDRVGMVFQSYALLPWLTVESNVSFAARMHGFDHGKVTEVTETICAWSIWRLLLIDILASFLAANVSGSELPEPWLSSPKSSLWMNPFLHLIHLITDELHEDVLRIWEETKKTVIIVSHNFEEAVLLAERVGLMRSGRLEQVIQVTLARPRRQDDPVFTAEVHKLRQAVERIV